MAYHDGDELEEHYEDEGSGEQTCESSIAALECATRIVEAYCKSDGAGNVLRAVEAAASYLVVLFEAETKRLQNRE